VGEASGGEGGGDIAGRTAPDVMLLDVRMPELSGIEACALIKGQAPAVKYHHAHRVPTRRPTSMNAIKNGASGYLLKDSSIDEVSRRSGWSRAASR